jgi:hypothetical protein
VPAQSDSTAWIGSVSRTQVRRGFLNLLPGPTHPDLRASTMEIGDMQLAAVISDNFSTQR